MTTTVDEARRAQPNRGPAAAWDRYWFPEISPMRLRVLSVFVFAAILLQLKADSWVLGHAYAPESFWQPVLLARALHLPPPSPVAVGFVLAVLVAGSAGGMIAAATGRFMRVAAGIVLAAYVVWLLWAFSYSKVDHDRLTILVTLLAFAATPRRGPNASTWAGWATRLIQITFLLAYPLSAISKLQHGGIDWMQSATFARAILRRGTWLGDHLLEPSWLLLAAQWSFVAFEVFAIVLILPRGRLRALALAGVILLHATTYATIGIHFLPHTICILAFFPLERLPDALRRRLRPGPRPGDVTP